MSLTEVPEQASCYQADPPGSPYSWETDIRGGSGWLDSLFPFLSGASRVADYAAVSRVVRLS